MGLSFGRRGGLVLLTRIKHLRPTLPVLVVSTHSEEVYARRSFKAGAMGYATNDSSRAEVVSAIRQVMSGGRYVSPHLTGGHAAEPGAGRRHSAQRALSDRELEVMRLLASGMTVRDIASLLSVSDGTVRTYRARLLHKLAVKRARRPFVPVTKSH
jgi:DNA-binding NarL/FixJ family response regulator